MFLLFIIRFGLGGKQKENKTGNLSNILSKSGFLQLLQDSLMMKYWDKGTEKENNELQLLLQGIFISI